VLTGGDCAKPAPNLPLDAARFLEFILRHGTKRPQVAGMGEHLGFDLRALQQLAEWLGFEIGEEELEWIEAVEEEWKAAREAHAAWLKAHPQADGAE
jgi:hypothetical protein